MKEAYENIYHEIEKDHFWFKARRKFILQLLEGSSKDLSILDIGCSSGILLNDLIDIGFEVNNMYGIDISSKAVQNCKENGIQNAFIMDAQHIDLKRKFDIIIASDCLEHIQDDEKALMNWHDLLNPGGQLFVFVPAFTILWGEHDVVNLHFRRYTRNTLQYKLDLIGYEMIRSGYWNFILFIPVLFIRIISRIKASNKQSSTGDLTDLTVINGPLFQLLSTENKILRHINFPFGVSTFCVAKKTCTIE